MAGLGPEQSGEQLLSYTRGLIKLRNEHPVFRRPKFFQGRKIRGQDVKDIMWFNPGGTEMNDEEWNSGFVRCLGMLLSGKAIDVRDEQGEPIVDDTFLVLFNAHHGRRSSSCRAGWTCVGGCWWTRARTRDSSSPCARTRPGRRSNCWTVRCACCGWSKARKVR